MGDFREIASSSASMLAALSGFPADRGEIFASIPA
jgi:hypothetical protein